jgi:hypothetical protein
MRKADDIDREIARLERLIAEFRANVANDNLTATERHLLLYVGKYDREIPVATNAADWPIDRLLVIGLVANFDGMAGLTESGWLALETIEF